MLLRTVTLIFLPLVLLGCQSSSKQVTDTQHLNEIEGNYLPESRIIFAVPGEDKVTFLGLHDGNDSIEAGSMLYMADAGLVGLIAQVATHAAVIDSARDSKLAEAQSSANKSIQSLISATETWKLSTLVGDSDIFAAEIDNSIQFKPTFFSDPQKKVLSMKSVIAVPNSLGEAATSKDAIVYQNLISVFDYQLLPDDLQLDTDIERLELQMKRLLSLSLHIAKQELTGEYRQETQPKHYTYIVNNGMQQSVYRGYPVDEKCGYTVIRDLRSWLIAVPIDKEKSTSKCFGLTAASAE
ncbi:hypothetical protein K6Q96_11000 [Grimontia kaedaensis]|uniref:DUF2884 family protein n=1 Tax=Grimontia kaedaensis TaxID=2872157 RepID=A0ABY4WPL3_9GAMM|nr:hypothetical protein [Grimontia kaedaensis]USH01439.1 hypothetical protein K6Q96_11000 [Grimontia kaedaensis]